MDKTYFEKIRKTIVHKILTLDCGSCLKYMYHHIMFGICVLGERDDQAMKLTKSQPLPPQKKLNLENCFGIYLENIFTFYTPVFECECLHVL